MTSNATSRIDHYRCRYCSSSAYTSTKEREVRTHIEKASDDDHGGREGFSPLTDVEAVDSDGNVVDKTDGADVKREPDDFGEICEPDDDLTTTERRIVATQMMYPDYSARQIVDFLEQKGHEPKIQNVHETLRDYFGTTETARGERSYEDFKERQQRAIDAAARWCLGEFETQREAAEAIGEQRNYVTRHYNDYEDIVERRKEVLKDDDEGDCDDEKDTETVRRQNGTGTYEGSKVGVDARMQHFSERPVGDDSREDSEVDDESEPGASREQATESKLAAARGQVDLLSRLVTNGELDAKVAFAEIKRILAEMETGADADLPDDWTFHDLGV